MNLKWPNLAFYAKNRTNSIAAPTTSPAPPQQLSTPAGPRKLTKGSRKGTFKDSGINFTECGILEDTRDRKVVRQPSEDIFNGAEVITLTAEEINELENGDDTVFEESWEEIPDLE